MDLLVEALNDRARGEGLVSALEMADLILDAFFDGEPAQWRAQGQDNTAFRALLHHDRLEPSTTTIWYALGIREQCEQLPRALAHALSLAHHRALLPVEDRELKESLAQRAVQQGWSKRRLTSEVRRATPRAPTRGRPRSPALVKAARLVRKALRGSRVEPIDPDEVERFGRRAALEALADLRRDLAALAALVEDAERLLTEHDPSA